MRLADSYYEPSFEEIDNMSQEQITLFLARSGLSPEDTRRGLERCMAMIDAVEAAERLDELAVQRWYAEGGR